MPESAGLTPVGGLHHFLAHVTPFQSSRLQQTPLEYVGECKVLHIPPTLQKISSHPPDLGGTFGHGPLPSAFQAHIPSLRQTPHYDNTHVPNAPSSPFVQRNNAPSHTSQHIHSISPIPFYQPQPVPTFTEPHTIPPFNIPQPDPAPTAQIPFAHTHFRPPPPAPTSIHPSSDISYVNHSLPFTKDTPILMGKHGWGPWHSAVCILILNANLLGHIADDPLPGAVFDPGSGLPILLLFTSGPTLLNSNTSLTGDHVMVLLAMSLLLVSHLLFLEAYPLPMNAWVSTALQGPYTSVSLNSSPPGVSPSIKWRQLGFFLEHDSFSPFLQTVFQITQLPSLTYMTALYHHLMNQTSNFCLTFTFSLIEQCILTIIFNEITYYTPAHVVPSRIILLLQ